MTAAFFRHTASAALSRQPVIPASATPVARRLAYAVRLVDRRTGQTHRVNGSPLVLFTRNPEEAVADLLDGRDATVWEARVEPIETASRQ